MSDGSSIEWTDASWNAVVGCTKVSPGCDHCYAERITERFHGKGSFAVVQRSEEKLYLPLKWRKPRRVFVNSMSDLFHDDVPDSFIAGVFNVMWLAHQHTFQVLTKRHGRMRSLLSDPGFARRVLDAGGVSPSWDPDRAVDGSRISPSWWPLKNVWLGVSVENQQWADIRIPALLDTPAAVRWLSCEPLLGPVDLASWLVDHGEPGRPWGISIGWVVVGGESGLASRPMNPDWARSLRDQCTAAEVPFFFKQWGGRTPKANGRTLDERTWDEYPAVAHA